MVLAAPIRGQPRRVDTNELRQFSQTYWINACVKTIIDEIASLDWDIVPLDTHEYEEVEMSITEVKKFLANPNKNGETFNCVIRQLLKDILELDAGVLVKVYTIDSYDFDQLEPKSGAPMLKPFGQRKMVELYARDGASFLKETDKFGFVRGYWQYSYQIPAHPMWFNKDEIVYLMEQPRSLSCYGFARTQAVLDIVKSLYYSTLYNKKFFEEVPLPEGVLALKETNETEMKTFMDWWNREFKAQPHKLGIVNKDIAWQSFTIPNKELEFLETQKQYFNFVIAMFGLTPSELGLTEDLNRSTAATQAELTKRKGIRPILNLIEKYINADILPEFGFEGIEFSFIYDDPAEKSVRLSNFQMELSMGIRTPNEIREELGMEPIEGGDLTSPMIKPKPEEAEESQFPQDKENRDTQEGKPIKKGLTTDSMQEVFQQASADFGISVDKLRQGFEVELEHAETVNNDYNIVLEIAIDHLKEDENYYDKLKTIEKGKISEEDYKRERDKLTEAYMAGYYNWEAFKREVDKLDAKLAKAITESDMREITRRMMIEMSEEIYRILIASGMSQMEAARYSQKIRSRARQKSLKKRAKVGDVIHWYGSGNRIGIVLEITERGYVVKDDFGGKTRVNFEETSEKGKKEREAIEDFEYMRDMAELRALSTLSQERPLSDKEYDRMMELGRKLKIKKGLYDGQYYNVPSEVIRPDKGEIVQPQANELKDPIEQQDTITCPVCGKNTLAQMNSADDVGTQIKFRCSNCAAILTQEELETIGLDNMETTMEANNSSAPISIPRWSPKSAFNKVTDWVGFDVNKAAGDEVDEYIDSKAYIRLLSRYLKDLSAIKRNKLREIIKDGIKNNLSYSAIIKTIVKNLGINKDRAESIARTETVRVSNESKIKKLEGEGIKKGVWLTARDERTCKICRPKHNKTYSLKSLKGAIPQHVNCRCTFSEI